MVQTKIGDETVIARIAQEPCDYDLGLDEIVSLRKAGVSSKVVAAMIRKCGTEASRQDDKVAHGLRNGVYAVVGDGGSPEYTLIVPAIVAAGRSGGPGTLFLPAKARISLPNEQSELKLSSRPRFWIVVNSDNKTDLKAGSDQAQNPKGFAGLQLVRLQPVLGKRQLQTGAFANGRAISGIESKHGFSITLSRVSSSTYSVVASAELASGEYALLVSDGGDSYRLYDFTVQ